MSEWQPIETAPNGQPVLVLTKDSTIGMAERADDWWYEVGSDGHMVLESSGCECCGDVAVPVYPTHWMPLPEPPRRAFD